MNDAGTYTILGAARSGLAVAKLLLGEGAGVFVSEHKPAAACGDAQRRLEEMGAAYEFGGHTGRALESAALVLSPGVPDTLPIVVQARERGMAITNEIEIAWRRCPADVVAITGTNGKTTTAELIGHIFRTAGRRTFVAGNVGVPFSQIVGETDPDSVVVLEVSSFQLEHIERFKPRVAVLMNVTPDHMDRYPSFEAYREAKYRIAMNQDSGDALVYNADDENVAPLAARVRSQALPFSIRTTLPVGAFQRAGWMIVRMPDGTEDGTEDGTKSVAPGESPNNVNEEAVIQVDDIRIRGPHNLYNAMAATLSASRLGVGVEVVADALRSFPGVPHRLEPVREVGGVRWVNDSKATNVDSLWYALSSFDEPIVLIAGGRGKKNVYDSVLPLVAERVKAVVLVGEAADEMQSAFAGRTAILRAGHDMREAVRMAQEIAVAGDVVLLSPACASFDMFDNYEHRGDVFRELVAGLEPDVQNATAGEA